MAAPALATREAPEMAAAVIHKKERLPTLETAPDLLVLFSHRRRFIFLSPLRNPKLSLAQYEPQRYTVRRAMEESSCQRLQTWRPPSRRFSAEETTLWT